MLKELFLSSTLAFHKRLGHFLFRYRSYTPLVLGVSVFLPFSMPPTGFSVMSAALFCLGAEGLRLWAVRHATGATRTREDHAHPLCTTGPYAIVRNPLYVGNIVLYATTAGLFTQSWFWVVVGLVLFLAQYGYITTYEYDQCLTQFEDVYRRYVHRVPAWIPRWPSTWDWAQVRAHASDSWDLAFYNERRSLTALGLVWGVFGLKWMMLVSG